MIHYRKDTHHIVTLSLDMEGRSHNVINHEIGEAMLPVVRHLQAEKKRGALRGVIITSAKKTFLGGGDLEYLYRADDAGELFSFAQKLKEFMRDLERPGVPVVAAINGDALGTGYELALACHHRVVLSDPRIKLGLPEIRIGLIPSGGAIVRLMWLLGIERAYPILRQGKRYSPQEALRAGLVDQLADSPKELIEKARQWILTHRSERRPWDTVGAEIAGGTADQYRIAGQLREMTAQLSTLTHDNYPAPRALLNILSEGSKVDFDTACRLDSRAFAELVRHPVTKNMIATFWFDMQAIKSGIGRPRGFGKFRPRKIGIIGAGRMGSGIALACLRHGMRVVLKDVSRAIAERGREMVVQKMDELIEQGTFQPEERDEILGRITTTEKPTDFVDCDLVIEAVFENAMVKQKVTREAESQLDDYAIFGTNTISIPITRLATASIRPQNYVGLHFFAPADEVPLVEIVRGADTSDETIARAFDFVSAIRKVPVVVKDDWGFYAARVQNTYILEGIALLQEGYPPALIENLGRQAGMPSGPLAMADDLGLKLVLRYESQAAEHYGSKYIQNPSVPVLEKMLSELNRPGRNRKAGFFEYLDSGERRLWPDLAGHFPATRQSFDRHEITERLLFAQVIEAVWCLQEKVIQSPEAANLASVFAWGFPAYKGGVIRFIEDYGKDKFIARCGELQQKYGPRFRPPRLIGRLELNGPASRSTAEAQHSRRG